MSRYVHVPEHADLERSFRGSFEGDTLHVELWQGYASDGYKSDYERRPARWLAVFRQDAAGKTVVRNVTRYGGKRFDVGPRDWDGIVSNLLEAGVRSLAMA